jgi:hypothetical protein
LSVVESVLDVLASMFDVVLRLVAAAIRLEVLVVGHLAYGFLRLAGEVLRGVLDLVIESHGGSFLLPAVVCGRGAVMLSHRGMSSAEAASGRVAAAMTAMRPATPADFQRGGRAGATGTRRIPVERPTAARAESGATSTESIGTRRRDRRSRRVRYCAAVDMIPLPR